LDIGPDSLSSPFAALLPETLRHFADVEYRHSEDALEEWAAADPYAQPAHLEHYIDHALVRTESGQWRYRFDARGLSSFVVNGVSESDLWRAVDRITAPTLLIRGEFSQVLSRSTAAQVVGRLAHGALIEICDAGHDLGVEQPEVVAAATRAFLLADRATAQLEDQRR
jgi:pimeloyl-ACP methyl ester carboxylesterase